MSMIDRSLDGMVFLTGQLGAVLKRRLREAGGIALISLAMMAALALATWSVHDPSLSHATDARVHNLLGRPGAVAADLMMQLLGLGSVGLLLPIGVWGYRLLGHRPLSRERLRVLFWLLGAVLAAAFASCLPRSTHWPLPSGLGGVVGDAVLRVPPAFFGVPLTGTRQLGAAIVLGVAALMAFAAAAGIIWRDSARRRRGRARRGRGRERMGLARPAGALPAQLPGAPGADVPPQRAAAIPRERCGNAAPPPRAAHAR